VSLDRLNALALLLADAAGVQAFLGAADETEALAEISIAHVEAWTRPGILLATGERARQLRVAGGGAHVFGEEAAPIAIFERDMLDADDPATSCVEFANVLGPALLDIAALAGTGSHPRLRSIRLDSFQVSDFDEVGADYVQAVVTFDWGTP